MGGEDYTSINLKICHNYCFKKPSFAIQVPGNDVYSNLHKTFHQREGGGGGTLRYREPS